MSFEEKPLLFDCEGQTLVGILTLPRSPKVADGVLIVVGGPQYRVGSHRQFVLLSRALGARGIPSMRFDYRGMGDSDGEARSFEALDQDIAAAIDCFVENAPKLRSIVLWGLCDAASAACFYAHRDRRVAGLVLLNPWVRTEAGAAEAYLKTYYLRRLFERSFWSKLLAGRWSPRRALADLIRMLGLVFRRGKTASRENDGMPADLPSRMAADLHRAALPLLLILSGRDYVANEFDNVVDKSSVWKAIVAGADVQRIGSADHTFSRREWRDSVAASTAGWIESLSGSGPDRLDGNDSTARGVE